METRLEVELKPGDLEGLVLDKFLVDAFKPKLCDEKDIAVIAFLVKEREPAKDLSSYIAQGQFDLIDVETSSAPDKDGNYALLVEMNRNHEMFDTMNSLLDHINHLVNIEQWHFKPSNFDEFIIWNKENFVNTVPQNLESYLNNQGKSTEEVETVLAPLGVEAEEFNYQLLGKVIEEQITKSSQNYIKAFQKQFKVIIKDNRRLLQHIEDLKSDHQYLHQQLELYEKREKMALLREQQDFKRIRTLEHQLSLLEPYDADNPEIVIPKASTSVTIESAESSGAARVTDRYEDRERNEKKFEEFVTPVAQSVSETPLSGRDISQAVTPDLVARTEENPRAENLGWGLETPAGDTTQSEATPSDAGDAVKEEPKSSEPSPEPERGSEHKIELPTDTVETRQQKSDPSAKADPVQGKAALGSAKHRQPVAEPDSLSKSVSVKELVAQGLSAVKQKNYYEAIDYFIQVTEQMPNARRSLLRIAVLFYRLKDFEAARTYAKRALDLGAESAKRILTKIDKEQLAISGETISEENAESPTEEAIIWGADDFEEDSAGAEAVKVGQSDEFAGEQDVIIFGQQTKDADRQEGSPVEKEDSTSPDDEPSTETVALDFQTLQDLVNSKKPTASPENSPGTSAAKKYFSLGLKAFEQKEYHSAIDYFTKVTELLPNARRSFIRLAALHYRLKEYEAARKYAKRALDLGSKSAQRILEKIETKSQTVTDEPTATEFVDTLSEFPALAKGEDLGSPKGSDAKKYFTRGVAAFEQKDYQKAIENFTQVTKFLPNAPRSFFRLAILHYRLKDYEKARIHAQRAIDLGSNSARRILEKIEVKQTAGPAVSALAESAEALPEFPILDVDESKHREGAVLDRNAGVSKTSVGTHEGADPGASQQADAKDLESLDMESATETISLDTATLVSSDLSQTSAADTESFPKSDPVSDYFALGLAAAEQESYHRAIENFTKVTELLPDAPASYLNLANLYLKLKDYEQAQENAKRALDLGSESAKRILEKLEAEKWTASAMSSVGSGPSDANKYITTDG